MSALNKSNLGGISSPQLRPLKGSPLSDKTNTFGSLSDKTNTHGSKSTGSPIQKSTNHFSSRDLTKSMAVSESVVYTNSGRLDGTLEGKENRSSLTKLANSSSIGSVSGVGLRDGMSSSTMSSCMVKTSVQDIEVRFLMF
jgi:hypothetical protein